MLTQSVSFKSVSADPRLRKEIIKMMQWAQVKLQALRANVTICNIGIQV